MFRLERHGAITRLILDRPETRNAIPADGWGAIGALLDEAVGSGERLLVVTGAGRAFCAGADLRDFAAMRRQADAPRRFRLAMRGAIDRLAGFPLPTVAWIEGPCYGAGVALALACDLRIAGPGSRFAVTPARIGLSYPQEDVHRLVAAVGPGQAARLLFTGESVDGAEAARIGLVEMEASGAEEFETIVDAIVANEPGSLETLKRSIALAVSGRSSDPDQDARFDARILGDAFGCRLEALLRKC